MAARRVLGTEEPGASVLSREGEAWHPEATGASRVGSSLRLGRVNRSRSGESEEAAGGRARHYELPIRPRRQGRSPHADGLRGARRRPPPASLRASAAFPRPPREPPPLRGSLGSGGSSFPLSFTGVWPGGEARSPPHVRDSVLPQ